MKNINLKMNNLRRLAYRNQLVFRQRRYFSTAPYEEQILGTDESWGLNVEEMNQLVYKDQFMFQGRFGELTFANSNYHLIYDAHTFAL